jgi:dsDNA-specific endonuclease/ATPase MutS2
MKKNLTHLKRGDKVQILDDAITGVVSRINGDKAIVLTEDDFEMEFDISELVLVNDALSKRDFMPDDISQVLSEKVDKQSTKVKRIRPKDRNQPAMEVDLHIHQLVPKSKGMNNYDMLTIQIETAKRQLDFAIKKKIQRIVFIHGIGEGVLRAELEYLFRQYGNLQFNDADYQKYGRGATEVYIFQNKKP